MTVIHAPAYTLEIRPDLQPVSAPKTELDAVNAIVDAQRAAGESVDPAGAKRFVRVLVAVGLLRFE